MPETTEYENWRGRSEILTVAKSKTFRCQRGHELTTQSWVSFQGVNDKYVICFDCLGEQYGMQEVTET